MTMKNILALVGAIVVGFILVKVFFVLLGVAIKLFMFLIWGAVVATVVYVLYRVFSGMLGAGRRLSD